MEDEIDLRDIFRVLWKRRLLIIGVFVAFVLAAGVISFAISPEYKISSIVAVGNFDDPVYASQASMLNVMNSDEFALEVFEQIRPNSTGSEFQAFKGGIDVAAVKGSDRLIGISIETKKKQEGLMAIEMMIQLYANRSDESYNRQKKILSDQLAYTLQRLAVIDHEVNQTQEVLLGIQGMQDLTEPSTVQGEMQFSRTLDRLNGIQALRSALIDRRLDLEKQLELVRNLKVVQPPVMPANPVWPRKALIVGIAGVIGLMIGIFAAFLREGLGRPAE